MNKLLVKDSIVNIKDSLCNLDIKTSDLTLIISGNVCINDYDNNSDLNLKILMEKSSHLLYNRYNEDIRKFNLDIELTNDSFVEFNYSLKTRLLHS